jgi:hypothetical protein
MAANGAYAYWEGYAALSGGDPTRAITAFERARAVGKWPAWSRHYIAASQAAMGHPDLALDQEPTSIPLVCTAPPPYSPSGITPSKSPYSSGWSSVRMASRRSLGFMLGPLGTAQLLSTPSHSSRES